ncbi:MAG: hypothetical protein ACFFDN_18990 [Candidatus Hodarchaeota archaeon]
MSKKNIIFGLLIFLMIGITLNILSVKADAPITMTMTYDYDRELGGQQNQILSVWITHGVSDPNSHYIETVAIEVNGSLVLTVPYTSQPTHNMFEYHYNVIANMDGVINVTATCIRGGSLSESLDVGHPHIIELGSFSTALVPSIAFTILVIALVYFLPYLGKKRLYKKEIIVGLGIIIVGIAIAIVVNFVVASLPDPGFMELWH